MVERLRLEAAWHDEVDAACQSQRARIGVVKRKHVLQTRRDCRENALARGIRIEDWKAQAVSLQVRQQRAKEAAIVAVAVGRRRQRPRRLGLGLHESQGNPRRSPAL